MSSSSSCSRKARFVLWDLEATSLDTSESRILQWGALDYETGASWCTLVNPDTAVTSIPADALKIHGITLDQVRQASVPNFIQAFESFAEWLGDDDSIVFLIAHYAFGYDMLVLEKELQRHGGAAKLSDKTADKFEKRIVFADSLDVFDQVLKLPKGQRGLAALYKRFCESVVNTTDQPKPHDALGDCQRLQQVIQHLPSAQLRAECFRGFQTRCKRLKLSL